MWIGVLGPLEVHLDGSDVPLEAAKERELLSALAVRCPAVVSRAWLIEVLWGSDPPATAERTLASHVSRLRHAVGATAVLTEPGGYRLDTDLTRTDAGDLAVLTRSAEDELRAGRVTTARCHAAEALRLWRGDPLADLTNEEIRTSETVRLDELRRRATRAFVDAELALGNHEAVIADLEAAVAREPLHEPWWGQLMIALYRSGRQADALRAYERLRVHLCDELGIEPAPDIAALQVRILRQDPALDPVPPPIPTNLPAPIGSFIGRTTERRRLAKALDQDRVVSLVGTGGVGKTRLALETAADVMDRYGDGVWWVDLAPIHHGTEITPAIRRAIGLRDGVAVSEHLRQHPDTLVVLDNAEHLTDAVAPIVRSLAESTAVHVLVTSRERLSVAGEVRITLEPLPTPSDDAPDDGLGSSEAVRLFLDRAASMTEDASDDDLTAVASICRLLDGVPLAIEVAAARTVAFRPRQIADELAKRCAAISDQPAITDPRYSSLGEAIGWSVDLLDPPARQLYPQLSVFVGGFEADDVEQVCTIEHATTSDALWQLVDASLVRVDNDLNAAIDRHRFDLLAAIRDDALRRLDDADADALEARHSSHFRRLLVDSSSGRSASPSAPPRIRAQHGNLHRAWETTLRSGGTEQLARFTVALAPACYAMGDLVGAIRIIDAVLASGEIEDDPAGWLHYHLVWPLVLTADVERALQHLERADAIAGRSDDPRLRLATATALAHGSFLLVGDVDAALPLYRKAIDRCADVDDPLDHVAAKLGLAQALTLADRPDDVAELIDEVARTLDSHPDDGPLAHLFLDRALLAWATGDDVSIVDVARRGQHHADAAGLQFWKQVNVAAEGVGQLLEGDLDGAEFTLLRAARQAVDDGNLLQFGIPVRALAVVASLREQHLVAARLLGASRATTPDWPLLERRLVALLEPSRSALGDVFDAEMAHGLLLAPASALSEALCAH